MATAPKKNVVTQLKLWDNDGNRMECSGGSLVNTMDLMYCTLNAKQRERLQGLIKAADERLAAKAAEVSTTTTPATTGEPA